MNKLTALYTMMKQIKETEAFSGSGAVEARLDDTVLGTMTSEFSCAPGHCEKKMEVRFGEEVLKFEHQGTDKLKGMCCAPGQHMHGHGHGGGCCGPKGKLSKAMFMLKLLDKTELQELEDGRKILTLELTAEDLPKHMKEHMKNHCCGMGEKECCGGHHEKLKDWMTSCGCMDLNPETIEPQSVSLKLVLAADCSPAEVNVVIKATAADKEGKTHSITLKADGLKK